MSYLNPGYRLNLFIVILLCTTGCGKMVASSAASFMEEIEPALFSFWDVDIAGQASASSLLQLEGLHSVDPENDDITLMLVKAYTAYTFAYVENKAEEAELKGDFDAVERHRQRSALLYKRASDLAFSIIRNHESGLDEALKLDEKKLLHYLRENYTSDEEAHYLFWAAISTLSYIKMTDDLSALMDLWAIRVFGERIIEIDPDYEKGSAYALLGAYEGAFPRAMGGDMEKCKQYFEKAFKISKRRNHMFHITFASTYAVEMQDRELFVSLMREILEAGDMGNDVRLTNKVARRRAERYITTENLEIIFPTYE